jgi:hypothetical protein
MTKDRSPQIKPVRPDPKSLNAYRALSAAIALDAFRRQTGADFEDAVCDLLADLMHWCDQFGQRFHEELRRARNHYGDETAASSETNALLSDDA